VEILCKPEEGLFPETIVIPSELKKDQNIESLNIGLKSVRGKKNVWAKISDDAPGIAATVRGVCRGGIHDTQDKFSCLKR